MPVADYLFLTAGMLDVTQPNLTRSFAEKAAAATQAAALKSVQGVSRPRARRRR